MDSTTHRRKFLLGATAVAAAPLLATAATACSPAALQQDSGSADDTGTISPYTRFTEGDFRANVPSVQPREHVGEYASGAIDPGLGGA